MTKNPASTFFWTDWENDPELRLCSLAAQGFWMRCLCVAARQTPKGFVAHEGRPMTLTALARMAGCSEQEAEAYVSELLSTGAASRDRAGRIYNRRMVKRAKLSSTRAEAGEKGAAVTNGKSKHNSALPQQNDGKEVGKQAGKSPPSSFLPLSIEEKTEDNASGKKRAAPKTAIDPNFAPDPTSRLYAEKKGYDPHAITPEFVNFWLGDGGRKADWQATYRNRVDQLANSRRPQGSRQPSGSPRGADLGRIAMEIRAAGGGQGLRTGGVPPDSTDHRGTAPGDSFAFESTDQAGGSGSGDYRGDPLPVGDQDRPEAGRQRQADDGRLHRGIIEVPG